MSIFVSYLVVLVLLNLMWEVSLRTMWALLLFLFALVLTSGPSHWYHPSPSHALGVLVLLVFVGIPLLVFAIRLWVAASRREIGPLHVVWVDHVLAGTTGGLVVAIVFRSMALDGYGPDHAVSLHLWLAGAALALCGIAYFAAGLWQTVLIGSGFGLLALTVWSGLWFPANVLNRADAYANGADYQLESRMRGVLEERTNLTFLTMPKARWGPHVVLSFVTEAGTCNAAWSYFATDFRTDNNMVDSRHCPRRIR